jgi:hypothetical protein
MLRLIHQYHEHLWGRRSDDRVGKFVGMRPDDRDGQVLTEIVGRGSVCATTALIGKRKHKSWMAVVNGDFYLREIRAQISSVAAVNTTR